MSKQKGLLDLNWKKNFDKVTNDLMVDQDLINNSNIGLTLLARTPKDLHQNISQIIQELGSKFPNQFFYPVERIHFTIIGLIPVKEKIEISKGLLEKLIPLIKNTLHKYPAFEIELNGLNITPISVFIQGFYSDNILDNIRKELILKTKTENLGFNLDHLSSFNLSYAWFTIMRFTDNEVSKLLVEVKKFRDFEFGKFMVQDIQLVTTDKCFSKKNTEVIHSYHL